MTTKEASLSRSPPQEVGKSPPYKSVLDLVLQQPLEEDTKSDLSLLMEVVKKERRVTRVRALRLESGQLSYSIDKQTRTELDGQVGDSPRLRERMRQDSQIRDYLPRVSAGENKAEKPPSGKGAYEETRKQRRRDKRRRNREKKRNEKNDGVTVSNEQPRVASDNALREQTGEDKPPVLERVITSITRRALPKVMQSQVRLAQQPIDYETVSVTPVAPTIDQPTPGGKDRSAVANAGSAPEDKPKISLASESTVSAILPYRNSPPSSLTSVVLRLPADIRPLVLPSETPGTSSPSPNLGKAPQTVAAPFETVSHPKEGKPVEQKVTVTAEGMQDQFLTPILTAAVSIGPGPSSQSSGYVSAKTKANSPAVALFQSASEQVTISTSGELPAVSLVESTASEVAPHVAPVSIEQSVQVAPSKTEPAPSSQSSGHVSAKSEADSPAVALFQSASEQVTISTSGEMAAVSLVESKPNQVLVVSSETQPQVPDRPFETALSSNESFAPQNKSSKDLLRVCSARDLAQFPSETQGTSLPSPNLGEAPQTVAAPFENVSHPKEGKPVEQKVTVTAEGMQDQFLTPVLTAVKSLPSTPTSMVYRLPASLRSKFAVSIGPGPSSQSSGYVSAKNKADSSAVAFFQSASEQVSISTSGELPAVSLVKSTASEVAPVSIEQSVQVAPSKTEPAPSSQSSGYVSAKSEADSPAVALFQSASEQVTISTSGELPAVSLVESKPKQVLVVSSETKPQVPDRPFEAALSSNNSFAPQNKFSKDLQCVRSARDLAQFPSETPGTSSPSLNLGETPQTVASAPFETVSHPKEDKPVTEEMTGAEPKNTQQLLPSTAPDMVLDQSSTPNLVEAPQTVAAPFETVSHPKEDKPVEQKVAVTSERMQDQFLTPVLTAVKSLPSSPTSMVYRLPASLRSKFAVPIGPGPSSQSSGYVSAKSEADSPDVALFQSASDQVTNSTSGEILSAVSLVESNSNQVLVVSSDIKPTKPQVRDRPFETVLSSNESFTPQNKSSKDLQRVRSARDLAQFSQEEINFLVNEIYKPVTEEMTGAEPKNTEQLQLPPIAPDMVLVQSSAPNLCKAPQTVAAPFETVSHPKEDKPVEQKVSSTALNKAAATLKVSSSTLLLPEPTGDAEVDELMRQIATRGDRKVKLAGPCTENPHTYFYRQQEHFLQEVISTSFTNGIRNQLGGSDLVAPPIENESQLIECQQLLMEREKGYLKHVHGKAGEKHDSSVQCRECGKTSHAAAIPAASGPQTETDDGLLNGQWLLLMAYAVFITFILLAKLI